MAEPSEPPPLRVRLRDGVVALKHALRLCIETAPTAALGTAALAAVSSLLPLATMWLMKLTVDAVVIAMNAPDKDAAFRPVMWLAAASAGVTVLGRLVSTVDEIVTLTFGTKVSNRVADLVNEKALGLDVAAFERPEVYDLIHRAQQEAPGRPAALARGILDTFRSVIGIVASLGVTWTLHPLVPSFLLVITLPLVFVRWKRSRETLRLSAALAPKSRLAQYLTSLLLGPIAAKEVRTFGFGAALARRSRAVRDEVFGEQLALQRRTGISQTAFAIPGAAAFFGIQAWIAWRAVHGAITLGDLTLYTQAAQAVAGGFFMLFFAITGAGENVGFFKSFRDFLALAPTVCDRPDARPIEHPVRGALAARGVTYRYAGAQVAAVSDVTVEIAAGEHVAIVGRNGSGKTTLLKLLTRLYDPTTGRVELDGVDVRSLRLGDVRRAIGVLFQDFVRYDMTMDENVALALPEGAIDRRARIDRALEASGADAVAKRLPEGSATTLGQRFNQARDLSAGEWQRVALARLWAKDSRIVLLDEPTSALDGAAEADFSRRLAEALAGRTAVIVSHRWSTVRAADRVIVLEGGRVVEEGRPADLISHDGPLARLFGAQIATAS